MKKILLTTLLLTMCFIASNAQDLLRRGTPIRQTVTFARPVFFNNQVVFSQFTSPAPSRALRIDSNGVVYPDSACCGGGSGTPTGSPNKLAYFDSVGNLNSSGIINSLISPNVEAIADSDGNFIIFGENALILGRVDNNDNDSVTNIGVGLGAINFQIDNASGGIAIYQFPTDTPSIGETLIATYNDGNGQAALQWGDADTNRYLPLAGGTMDLGSSIFFGSGGQNISQGSFDNGTSGNQGVSLNCAIGYELNWQGGKLSNRQAGAYVDLIIDSSKLHVNGSLKFTDGTQGNGYILTSDSNGDASWQPKPYKEYFGYFQENGVLNDTIVVAGVLYNELGTITPIVDALGRYKFYGDFPINKTLVLCNASNSSGGAVRDVVITFDDVDEDFIQLDMRSKDTGLLQGDNLFHLQIKVLP